MTSYQVLHVPIEFCYNPKHRVFAWRVFNVETKKIDEFIDLLFIIDDSEDEIVMKVYLRSREDTIADSDLFLIEVHTEKPLTEYNLEQILFKALNTVTKENL